MAVMVFKRAVFETRKRPKGVLRPKQQNNLKEAATQAWPRTATERLLVSVCQGSAAQALGILEALSDSNRRTLVSAAPTPADMGDTEFLDVYAELFMAAQEIIYGGGGSPLKQQKAKDPCKRNIPLDGIVHDKSLMEMAAHGFDGVPVSFLVKLVKWSFCYQQWDFFDVWLPKTLALLQTVDFPGLTAELMILQAFDKAVMSRSKQRKQQEDEAAAQTASNKSLEVDDLLNLAEVLLGIVNSPLTPQDVDTDMVIDAAVSLWNKTKAVFHRCQNGILSNPKFLERIDSCGKWVEILEALNQIVRWCDLDSVDPVMASDISLRLALIFEAAAVLKTMPTVSSATRGLAQPSTSSLCAGDPLPSASLIKRSITTYPVFDRSPSELLEKACSILETGIRIASRVMNHRILQFPHAVADVIWAKEFNMELFDPVCPPCGTAAEGRRLTLFDMVPEDDEYEVPVPEKRIPTPDFDLIWELTKDFHIAMIFHYHRISLRLVSPGAVDTGSFDKNKVKEKWQNSRALVNTKASDVDDTGSALENACRSNRLSLAMHYLQRAKLLAESSSDGKSSKKFIDAAVILLKKYETEEKKLFRENVLDIKVDGPVMAIHAVPPPPVLLSRTDSVMVFKVTPFRTVNTEQIAWYRLFGRIASGADIKARLNDYNLPGTGELVAAHHGCKFYVSGLVPNERYTFALAAYTASGELIGNAIGESTKPILASPPMNLVMTWCYMCVVCNQLGFYPESREAFNAVWNHFIDFRQCPPSDWQSTSWLSQKDFTLTLFKLNESILERTSSILQRMLSLSIFAGVEATVMDEQLYCDALCEFGPVYRNKQLRRLALCEKLMPVMQLAGLLNDTNMALQAVVECYGLLASLIHFKIPSTPVIQVLLRCITVLQEIPGNPRRSSSVAESLMHMIACCSYHLSQVLRSRHELELADRFNEIGRRLLAPNYDPNKDRVIEVEESSMLDLQAAEEKPPKGEQKPQAKNPELVALEQSIQKINKQPSSGLTGNEDMNVLTGYIKFVPSATAYPEVKKFKRRPGYLQYLVQVAQKALSEGNAEQVITWCADAEQILVRRNEDAYGQKTGIGKLASGAILTTGEDGKSFQAALIEYTKEQAAAAAAKQTKGTTKGHDGAQGADKGSLHKDNKKDMISAQKLQAGQDPESKARFIMRFVFLEYYRTIVNWRKNRAVVADERPWRSQLNLVQGLSYLGILFNKLETMNVATARFLYRPPFLDQDWFMLDNANTMISDYTGLLHPRIPQPIQPSPAADESPMQSVRSQPGGGRDKKKQQPVERPVTPPAPLTAIELAAKSVTIEAPAAPATSRTARQEVEPPKKKGKNAPPDEPNFISRADVIYFLRCTFVYISRAAVLAHRGRHWTLLQNVCHDLLNSVELAMVLMHTPDKNTGGDLLSLDDLKTILCHPMYVAADLLLDMLQQTENHLNDAFRTCNDGDASKPAKRWHGELADEQGGAGTHFDVPYDDVSTVDVRSVKRVVLTSLELLFHELKWEKLVDIGLRFNALSGYRHTETVTPLIVHAQHKLIQRIGENGGKPGLQPHFKAVNKGKPISATDYLTLQLEVSVNGTESTVQKLEPGALIDPREHIPYSATRALQLSSVPLDVTYSLQSLRAALGEAQFSARSLQNSRRLLVLYLAGRTSRANHFDLEPQSEVNPTKLKATTSQVQVLPPDLNTVDFRAVRDITNKSLDRASITAVISSYEKTIESLDSKGRKGLKTEALRELGNVYYHAKNPRLASKCWIEALDTLLNSADVLNKWRSVFQDSTDIPRDMLQKCGLWGCLLGGIISSNIAQYILPSNLSAQRECCILSGNFFRAIFRTTLPHPLHDRDYALYDVGDYCEVANLVPGVDLLSEKFRADGRTVVAAVRFVADVLTRSHYSLFVLPLLTLYQFWATCVCRDVYRSVDCRIIRLCALIDLGFFSQAFTLLHRLMNGEYLPQLLNSEFRLPESTAVPGSFNTQLPLAEEGNMAMLEFTMDRCLSSTLGSLYGPQLTCRLALAQARLLTSIAATIPVIPSSSNVQVPETPSAPTPGTKKSGTPNPGPKAAQKAPKLDTKRKSFDKQSEGTAARDIALDTLKSLLLSRAENILVSISDSLTNSAVASGKGLSEMTASELEMIVSAKLGLGSISVQHHHTVPASQFLLDALNLLKNATVLGDNPPPAVAASTATSKITVLGQDDGSAKSAAQREKPDITSSSLYQLHNLLSRCHLDARLWLQCRRSLVRCLLAEVKSFGNQAKKGSDASQSVDDYCRDSLAEAELFGDIELQAEFLFYGAILFIVNGKPVYKAVTILQEVNKMLSGLAQLSVAAQLLLVNVRLHLIDLEFVLGDVDGVRTKYFELQELLLCQAESLGEDIESHCDTRHRSTSAIASPIKNIYLPHLPLLIQVKFRIGHKLASSAILSPSDCVSLWVRALGVLGTAFELNKVIASRSVIAAADLLLLMGQIQRQLVHHGQYPARVAGQTLIQAINTSMANEHDLSLIHKAYVELALIYMASSGLTKVGTNHVLEPLPEDPPTTEKQKHTSEKSKQRRSQSQEQVGRLDERTAAWLAVSCAASCVMAQLARNTLTSTADTLAEALGSTVAANLPDFLALDLVGLQSAADEKTDDIKPNTDVIQSSVDAYNGELRKAKQAAADLTWLNMLDYQSKLQRLCSTSVLNTTNDSPPAETNQLAKTSKIPVPINECTLLENPLLEDAQFDGSTGKKAGRSRAITVAIRYLPFTEQWLPRFGSLQSLLGTGIPAYSSSCQAVQPPTALNLSPVEVEEIAAKVVSRNYPHNQITKLDGTQVELKFSSILSVITPKPDEALMTQSKEGQLCTLWFQPYFDPDGGESDLQTMLLYAFAIKANKKTCGMRWVSVSRLQSLHTKLSTLVQSSEPVKPQDTKNKKKSNTTLAPSETDEKFMLLLEECLTEISEMLSLPVSEPDVPAHDSRHVHTSLSNVQPSVMSTASTVQPLPPTDNMMASNNTATASNRSLAVSNIETILSVMKSRVGLLEQMFRPGSGVVVIDIKLVSWIKLVLTS